MQSEVGAIQRLVLKGPRESYQSSGRIETQWRDLHYEGPPDFERAVAEHDDFAALLEAFGIEVLSLPAAPDTGLDAIYVRDAAIVCDKGAILCNMGKGARKGEPSALGVGLKGLDVPILGSITGAASIEGGDVAWIDERTLAVGRGYRTNEEGIKQLHALLGDAIDELIVVPLPHWRGPTDVFHLMSILSPIDNDLALVYSPLMPVPFREALIERGIELVEVPDAEFLTMGINVLAVAPRVCVMLEGNPETKARLESSGARVFEFVGEEICVKGAGGPTCLTRPLERICE